MHDLRSSALLLAGIFGFFSIAMWLPSHVVLTHVWVLRIVFPAVLFGLIFIALRGKRGVDRAPDFLASMFQSRQECNGLCFACDLDVRDGVAFLDVYFQNRYGRPCKATVQVMLNVNFTVRPTSLVHATFEVQGGAFGIARVPMAIPVKWQGREAPVLINASCQYAGGHGEKLRVRGGQIVGSCTPHPLAMIAAILLGGMGALLIRGEPIKGRLPFPGGVADEVPPNVKPEMETLWLPGDPEFDVSAMRASAA